MATVSPERQAENDAAYADVGPLPVLTSEEITARMLSAKASRIIYAQFRVDESDSQSDYYGGRSARQVIIGFGTGKRESFKQLREAAAKFPPTAIYGPGNDRYSVGLVWDHDRSDDPDRSWMTFRDGYDPEQPRKGHSVPWVWYSDKFTPITTATGSRDWGSFKFATKADCDLFIATNQPLRGTEWQVHCESFEHRENYSMGGGNYLGSHRYGGWIVKSTSPPMSGEFFEPPSKRLI